VGGIERRKVVRQFCPAGLRVDRQHGIALVTGLLVMTTTRTGVEPVAKSGRAGHGRERT
jgi:hypothetical protein